MPTLTPIVPSPTVLAASSDCPIGQLQTLINNAAAGSTVVAPACITREKLTINKSLILDGQGRAEVRGSDVWTNWSASGSTWVSTNTVPSIGTDTTGVFIDAFRASHLEQVFIDGTGLIQVSSNPTPAQFALDASRHVILSANPNGHLVEVTTRKAWVVNQANNVTLTNLTFRHAGTAAQEHAIGNDDHANWTLSNSVLTDAHGNAVGLGGGDVYSRVLNNTISRAGDLAIESYMDGHTLIQGNTLTNNGGGGWDTAWQAGAIKMAASSNLTIDNNTLSSNTGVGLWCDIGCRGTIYSNNRIHDNFGNGIMEEISSGGRITGNVLWNVSGAQPIYASSSAGTEIDHNTIAYSPSSIQAWAIYRADQPANAGTGYYVHDNIVIESVNDTNAISFADDGSANISAAAANNRGLNNKFWYPIAENGTSRFVWGDDHQSGSYFSTIGGFSTTPGGTGSAYLTTSQKDAALAAAGIP